MTNPEDLYRKYREIREKTSEISENAAFKQSAQSAQFGPEESEPVAALAYHIYRCTRTQSKAAAVDAIMAYVKSGQTNAVSNTVDNQLLSFSRQHSGVSAQQRSGNRTDNLQGFVSNCLDKLKRVLDIKILVPAAAFVLLAVLLIPVVTVKNDISPAILPQSMLDHASLATELIEQTNVQSLGFSTGGSIEKQDFSKGMLTTGLSLAIVSKNLSLIDSYQRQLSTQINDDELEIINGYLVQAREASASLGTVDSSTNPRSDDMFRAVQAFQTSLRGGDSINSTSWFDLGQSIEAISIGTRLSRESSVTQPLQDTLAAFSALEIPDLRLPASGLLEQLSTLSGQPESIGQNLDRIAQLCRDIKILMN